MYWEYQKQMCNLFEAIIAAIGSPSYVRRHMKAFATGLAVGFSGMYWEYQKQMCNLFEAIIAAIGSPSYVRRHMKAFHARDPRVVVRVCKSAAQEYRDRIASEHDRALGIDSRWARKHDRIAGAAEGAAGAVAYWTERSSREPDSPAAGKQLDAATEHSGKLTSALQSLDQHADAIRKALLGCRDKVDAMERRIDDVAQIRQLGAVPHTAGDGQALADTSVKAIAEELLGEAESVGAALADLSGLAVAPATEVAGDNGEQLADEVVEKCEQTTQFIPDLGLTATDEPQDPTPPQSTSTKTPSEPQRRLVEPPEAPPKREAQPSAKPWPDPAERIAELKRQSIASEAEFRQREREIQAESLQRRQEIQAESERRKQEIRARFGLDPPPTPPDPESASIDSLDTTPEDHPQAPVPAPTRSTSSQMSARINETEEEKQMKELVGMLRRMADLQDRRAHDLRFRDEYNWEADDREELGQKMTELADDIEMFQRLAKRMKDMESGNPGT